MVHTGAKTQLGGLNEGLLSVTYQVFTEDCVAAAPMLPAARQIKMAIIMYDFFNPI